MGEGHTRGWSRRRMVLGAIVVGCVLAAAGTLGVVLARGSGSQDGAQTSELSAGGTAPLSERAFLDLMIPHHQMAVDMARIALRRTRDLAVLEVARDILSAQPYEITLMKSYRRQWFGVPENAKTTISSSDAGMMGMGADMNALRTAKPFGKTFFADMIPHHAGAVVMAQRVLLGHPRPALARLARSILDTQSAEIGKMERFRQLAANAGSQTAGAPAVPATPATPATPGA